MPSMHLHAANEVNREETPDPQRNAIFSFVMYVAALPYKRDIRETVSFVDKQYHINQVRVHAAPHHDVAETYERPIH